MRWPYWICHCTHTWLTNQCFHISNIRVVLSFHCVHYWEVSNVRSVFLFHFISLPSLEAPDNIAFQNSLELLLLEAESGLKWKSKTTSTHFCKKTHFHIFLRKVGFLIPHHISIYFSWYIGHIDIYSLGDISIDRYIPIYHFRFAIPFNSRNILGKHIITTWCLQLDTQASNS